jgi:hypothetical protein
MKTAGMASMARKFEMLTSEKRIAIDKIIHIK